MKKAFAKARSWDHSLLVTERYLYELGEAFLFNGVVINIRTKKSASYRFFVIEMGCSR